MEKSTPPSYFESVDLLRGFAALSVVVYHVIELFGWAAFPSTGPHASGVAVRVALFVLVVTVTTVTMAIYWAYASFWNCSLMVVMWRSVLALAFFLILLFTISTIKVSGVARKLLSPLFYLGAPGRAGEVLNLLEI